MNTDDGLGQVKTGVGILGEVIKIAGENPETRAAGQELGKAALTVTKCINNALLPVAAVNFAFEKARKYFSTRFVRDLEEKAMNIPAERLIEPKASVAGPALQGLAFSHDEPALKEMYLHLLASAMDAVTAGKAHPAFVEIIRQLTSEEAHFVQELLLRPGGIPIVEVRLRTVKPKKGSWDTVFRHLLDSKDSETCEPVEYPALPAMVDNWVRLGLFDVTYDLHLTPNTIYAPFESRPEVSRFRAQLEDEERKIELKQGVLSPTAFGRQFAEAAGLAAIPK